MRRRHIFISGISNDSKQKNSKVARLTVPSPYQGLKCFQIGNDVTASSISIDDFEQGYVYQNIMWHQL